MYFFSQYSFAIIFSLQLHFFTFMLNDLTYCVDGFGMHEEGNANLKRNIVVVLKRECIYNIDSNTSISFLLYTSYHIWG